MGRICEGTRLPKQNDIGFHVLILAGVEDQISLLRIIPYTDHKQLRLHGFDSVDVGLSECGMCSEPKPVPTSSLANVRNIESITATFTLPRIPIELTWKWRMAPSSEDHVQYNHSSELHVTMVSSDRWTLRLLAERGGVEAAGTSAVRDWKDRGKDRKTKTWRKRGERWLATGGILFFFFFFQQSLFFGGKGRGN